MWLFSAPRTAQAPIPPVVPPALAQAQALYGAPQELVLASITPPEHNARVRIILVGDPGVGRSTLLHLLTHHRSAGGDGSSNWQDTSQDDNIDIIGDAAAERDLPRSSPDRWQRSSREGTRGNDGNGGNGGGLDATTFTGVRIHVESGTQRTYWIELLTLPRGSFGTGARATLYQGAHGIIAVHDLSSPRSLDAMWKCVADVLDAAGGAAIAKLFPTTTAPAGASEPPSLGSSATAAASFLDVPGPSLPVLVVGTKSDLVPGMVGSAFSTEPIHARSRTILDMTGAEMVMSVYSPPPLSLFTPFFDRVIANRHSATPGSPTGYGHSSSTAHYAALSPPSASVPYPYPRQSQQQQQQQQQQRGAAGSSAYAYPIAPPSPSPMPRPGSAAATGAAREVGATAVTVVPSTPSLAAIHPLLMAPTPRMGPSVRAYAGATRDDGGGADGSGAAAAPSRAGRRMVVSVGAARRGPQ
ncbi:hypothetical protein BC828DRAFT_387026 [Blastocladiella britannica]|nr:hypothetical protein BC828DRAFT_387026 [Blastocladiella britannica]